MITDAVFALLTSLVGFVSRSLPDIPMGPFAPTSSLWTSIGSLGQKIGWLGSVVPWGVIGGVVAFYMSCAGVALLIWILRFVLRVLRFNV